VRKFFPVASYMNDIWFSRSEPAKAVCLHAWKCDQHGNYIEDSSEIHSDLDQGGANGWESKSHSPIFISLNGNSTGKNTVASNDRDMIEKLEMLIKETKQAFQNVLSRNEDLESKLGNLRVTSTLKVPTNFPQPVGSMRTGSNPTSGITLNLPLKTKGHVFDISTPPAYKENETRANAKDSTKGRRSSIDSGRFKNGLSLLNG
jgi:hypothetical protein